MDFLLLVIVVLLLVYFIVIRPVLKKSTRGGSYMPYPYTGENKEDEIEENEYNDDQDFDNDQ